MSFSPLIRQLIDALRILPGVGQKTAQRMALQLLERDRSGGTRLAQSLSQAIPMQPSYHPGIRGIQRMNNSAANQLYQSIFFSPRYLFLI